MVENTHRCGRKTERCGRKQKRERERDVVEKGERKGCGRKGRERNVLIKSVRPVHVASLSWHGRQAAPNQVFPSWAVACHCSAVAD